MEDEFIPHTSTFSLREASNMSISNTSLPIADFKSNTNGNEALTIRRDIAIKQHDVKKEEILIDAQIIYRCRAKLQEIIDNKFIWNEVLLGIAAAGIGIITSAYFADIQLNSLKGVISFVIIPCITMGTGVAYIIFKNFTNVSAIQIAQEIMKDIPNPDEAVEVEIPQ